MAALHDLCWDFLFSCQMICKQHIIINHMFFWYKSNLEPVTYSPLLTKHCPRCSKIENYTNTHTTQLYFTDNFLCSFYLFSQSKQSLTKYFVCFLFFFVKVQNCHLVSLIVLVLQWMLQWSKRVSLRSVSSTNYPTSHHPQLSIFFFYMFTNFMHCQILQYT